MRIRPIVVSLIGALAFLAGSLLATSSASAVESASPGKRSCDSHSIELGGHRYVFVKFNMSCERAKRDAHHVYESHGNWEPKNFNCQVASNRTGASCMKRKGQNESFQWYPGD